MALCVRGGCRGPDKQEVLSGVQAAEKPLISNFRSVDWRALMLPAEARDSRRAVIVYFIVSGEVRRTVCKYE